MEPICMLQIIGHHFIQESYETSSRHAGIRARQLRKLGYQVTTSALGEQVTPLGCIKITLVNVWYETSEQLDALPLISTMRRIRYLNGL